MEKAVILAPSHSWVIALSAMVLNYSGRPRDAIPRIKRAIRLSPIHPVWFLSALGNAYYLTGKLDSAIDTFKKAVEREPESALPNIGLTYALVAAGINEEAKSAAAEVLRIDPAFSVTSWTQRHPLTASTQIERLGKNLLDAGLPK